MENKFKKDNEISFRKPQREILNRNRGFGLFDPFFDDFFTFPDFGREFKELDRVMKTDVHSNEKNYILEIELPGYNKEDISLELNNGYLKIEAKQNVSENDKNENGYVRRERYFGTCARSFYVGDIDEKDISASLDRGILTVSIPKEKKEETKKKIEIK